MDGFSTADGFIEVNESLEEMIKYIANEPSVGLYYVQQHTHNALPNLLHLQNRVVNRSRDTTLHTQDLEESIVMVDSMKQCGLSIAHDMVNDINKSLQLMSTSRPQRGLIHPSGSGKSSFWGNQPRVLTRSVSSQQDEKSSGNYFSTVLKSAKERAVSIKWPLLDPKEAALEEGSVSSMVEGEAEELPFSSPIVDETTTPPVDIESESENYDEFKAQKEAKLKEWLEEHQD